MSTVPSHVVHALEEELEEVRASVMRWSAVDFHYTQLGELGHQHHNVVVVRLELGLEESRDAENLNLLAKLVDVLVEELKVEELVKVRQHLLEAQLVVEIPPIESCRVFIINVFTPDISLHEASLLIIDEGMVETSLHRSALFSNNCVVVTLHS